MKRFRKRFKKSYGRYSRSRKSRSRRRRRSSGYYVSRGGIRL